MIYYSLSSLSFPSTVCQFLFSKHLNAINYSHVMLISVIFITKFFQSEYLSVINYLSSMVNSGYQGNFKFLNFFYKRILHAPKAQKRKQATFLTLDVFYVYKNTAFLFFVCLFAFCSLENLLIKKNKEVWNCLDTLNSPYYSI